MNLRLWPGVAIAALTVLIRIIAPLVSDGGSLVAVLAPVAGGLLILLWWLFFSRARWSERVGVVALMIVAAWATYFIVHPSIQVDSCGECFRSSSPSPVWLSRSSCGRSPRGDSDPARVSRHLSRSSWPRVDCSSPFGRTESRAAFRSSHGAGRRLRKNAC